jgi:hypothetical protein
MERSRFRGQGMIKIMLYRKPRSKVRSAHPTVLGIDQGHRPAGAPVADYGTFFLGEELFQTGFDFGGHGRRFSVFSFQFSVFGFRFSVKRRKLVS